MQLHRATFVLAGFCAVAFLVAPMGHAARKPGDSEFVSWAAERAQTHPRLQAKLDSIDYEVIFVPGILGSKLTIDGKFQYGEDPIDSAKLAYSPSQKVVAAPLDSFRTRIGLVAFPQKDIYGGALDRLALVLPRPPLVFPYDWRQDIDRSAGELQKFIQDRAAKKRLIIIAHSMGGLVSWRWKQLHYKDDADTGLVGMIIVGSPLRGTCDAVRMLVGGYSAPEGSPLWERAAIDLVFNKSHAAVLTFPSVYQLLPRYESDLSPCLKVKVGADVFDRNHHEVSSWLKRSSSLPQEQQAVESLRPFAAAASADPKGYAERVMRAVESGKRFRARFSEIHDGGNLALLYSEERSLSRFHTVVQKDNWFKPADPDEKGWLSSKPRTVTGTLAGDGRVAALSAKNAVQVRGIPGNLSTGARLARLKSEHGDLMNDPELRVFVNDNLPLWIQEDRTAQVVNFCLSVPELASEIKKRGWIVRPSAFAFATDSKSMSQAQAIANHNVRAAVGDATNVNQAILAYVDAELRVTMESRPNVGNDVVAAMLIESAAIMDPGNVNANSLNLLGAALARQERSSEAVVAMEAAARRQFSDFANFAGTNQWASFSTLHLNLSKSYELIGEKTAAREAKHWATMSPNSNRGSFAIHKVPGEVPRIGELPGRRSRWVDG